MMVTNLVRYNLVVRELYLEALSKLPWAEIVEPKGLSFDSARNVFLHLTLVEDQVDKLHPAEPLPRMEGP